MTDAEALARFEALVQAQRPADQPWSPVTDYSYAARVEAEGQHPDHIVEVFQPKHVLDVGCGPGHLVSMLRQRGIDARGCDKQATDPAAKYDVTDFRRTCILFDMGNDTIGRPDLVICREVLEHLTIREVKQAVVNLCVLSQRYVYVTTRFAQAPDHLLAVDTSDNLDPTHITMLNQDFLRLLFVLEGFIRRPDLEERLDWQQKGRVLVYQRP